MSGAKTRVLERLPDPARVRRCGINGCRDEIPDGLIMCRPHWDLVPPAHKHEAYSAWRQLQARVFGSAKRYLAAVRAAKVAAAAESTNLTTQQEST